ncbi:hypothetical protein [Pseudonocardia sp. EC080625-04]|uniref:hypothetical protein n=1 Tax=Pseudonocardia sp. EC080625-04 TaxID=1096868 RepID=UPI0011AE597E|nr:hypothetical protein [Pseudonocardia sp. EC080625-04]
MAERNTSRTVKVRFDGEARGLNRAARQAERDLQRLQRRASRSLDFSAKAAGITGLVGAIGSLGGPAIAGALAGIGSLGAAGGVLALAFSGVGDALDAFKQGMESGDWTEYNKLLAKMPESQREFTKQLVKTGQEFAKLKRTAADNALPGITRALDASIELFPVLDSAVARTGKILSDTGDRLANLFRTEQFKKDLDGFFRATEPVTRSMGNLFVDLTARLIKFDSEMRPAAQGFASFIDSLNRGLSRMFDEMAPYAEDFKVLWEGLGEVIEELLPLFGYLFGELAKTWGPVLKDVASWLRENQDEVRAWISAIASATPYLIAAAVALKGLSLAAKAVSFAGLISDMANLGGKANTSSRTAGTRFAGGLRGGLIGAAVGIGILAAGEIAGSFATQDWKGLGTTSGNYVLSGFQDNVNKAASLDFGGLADNFFQQGRRSRAELVKGLSGGGTTMKLPPFIVSANTEQASVMSREFATYL